MDSPVQLKSKFEQHNRLARLQMVQEKETGVHVAKLWRVRPQRLAQQLIEIGAPLLGDVIDIALAQSQLIMSRACTRRLYVLFAHFQIAIVRQPFQLIVDGWLLNKVREDVVVVLDHFADLDTMMSFFSLHAHRPALSYGHSITYFLQYTQQTLPTFGWGSFGWGWAHPWHAAGIIAFVAIAFFLMALVYALAIVGLALLRVDSLQVEAFGIVFTQEDQGRLMISLSKAKEESQG